MKKHIKTPKVGSQDYYTAYLWNLFQQDEWEALSPFMRQVMRIIWREIRDRYDAENAKKVRK